MLSQELTVTPPVSKSNYCTEKFSLIVQNRTMTNCKSAKKAQKHG